MLEINALYEITKPIMERNEFVPNKGIHKAIVESIFAVITSKEYIKYLGETFEKERRHPAIARSHKV